MSGECEIEGASRPLAADVAALALLTAAAAAAYVWTKAPLYNTVPSIDPWLYTALWTNFDQIQSAFGSTYYASRLPWIVPGYLANQLFDPETAYLIVHVCFFMTGGLLLYVMCRRYFGRIPARGRLHRPDWAISSTTTLITTTTWRAASSPF